MQTLSEKIYQKRKLDFFVQKKTGFFYNITLTRILNSNDLKRIFQYILPSSRKKYYIYQNMHLSKTWI